MGITGFVLLLVGLALILYPLVQIARMEARNYKAKDIAMGIIGLVLILAVWLFVGGTSPFYLYP
jgi:hypothetical protein